MAGTDEQVGYNREVVSSGLFHSVTRITILNPNNNTDNLDINITNHLSIPRWQTVLLITGACILGGFFSYVMYRVCHISFRRILLRNRGKRRSSPQEEVVNEILSNDGARQILSSLARTALNSQINRRNRDFSSQMSSMNAEGEVMDISERVVRVSFAPTVCTRDNSDVDETSLGGESIGPPPYDTLSSDPPTYVELNDDINTSKDDISTGEVNKDDLTKDDLPTDSENVSFKHNIPDSIKVKRKKNPENRGQQNGNVD